MNPLPPAATLNWQTMTRPACGARTAAMSPSPAAELAAERVRAHHERHQQAGLKIAQPEQLQVQREKRQRLPRDVANDALREGQQHIYQDLLHWPYVVFNRPCMRVPGTSLVHTATQQFCSTGSLLPSFSISGFLHFQ